MLMIQLMRLEHIDKRIKVCMLWYGYHRACCGMDIIAHVDCILLQSCLSWTSGYVDQVRKHKK